MRGIRTFVALLVLAAPLGAQGWIIPRRCIGTPAVNPAVRVPQLCATQIVRTRSDVHVELVGRVLQYEIDERFVNRGAGLGEADYLFPLPADAAFQDLALSVNGEMIAGETMNADSARRVYETIVRTQRDPALVEWMGHGLLRARIFPLPPGEEKRVVVRFQTIARREGDALRVDYLRGIATGNVWAADSSSFVLAYKSSAELGTPYSPTNELDVSDHDGSRRVTVRGAAREVTLLVPVRRSDAAAITMLPYATGNDSGFALITVTPPMTRRADVTPRDVTLVLDVSGSMGGRKIEQARAAGKQLLATLRPTDRFRLIDFSTDVRTFRDDLVFATPEHVREASRYLDALEAQGGTNIEGALREAMRTPTTNDRLPVVLFVTDGMPTVGDGNPDRLAEIAADAHRRVFTFGLGSDVNVSLLEQLALEGRGTAQFVRPEESVERMVGIVADRLVDPVLTDVRVRVNGDVKLSKMLPGQPADVFADEDLIILARYRGHGAATITIDGTRRGAPLQWTTRADFPDRDRSNPYVARLWATQRIGYLSAERRKHGANPELDDEIRDLGERYGIPTEFTSYLVAEPRAMATHLGMAAPASAPAMGSMRLQEVVVTGGAAGAGGAFEAAKTASAQRNVRSLAAVDSLAMTATRDHGASTRTAGGHTFELRDATWTDVRFTPALAVTRIKPYSRAYFALLERIPELRAIFALGDRLIVAGTGRAIELTDAGASELAPRDLDVLATAW